MKTHEHVWRKLSYGLGGVGPRLLLALCALIAVSLIGLGQYVVGSGNAPFAWPGEDWLSDRFTRAFEMPNALAFASPLFVFGAALFGAAAVRAAEHRTPSWPLMRGTRPQLPYLMALALSSAACLWVIVSLFLGHFHPTFRFIFVSAVGFAICTLVFRDLRDGRLRPFPLRWSFLLEITCVAAIVGTFVGINIRDLTDWRYASIGDEGGFFEIARRILDDSHTNWFSQRGGVYGSHPVLGSVWHSVNLLVFGSDMFGWKMGSLTAIAITLPVFYWLLRDLFSPRVAVFGTIFLAASHYLFSYAHTGYNNVFSLFPTVAALACLVTGLKRGSPALLLLCGVFAALGFYSFHSSRATIFIVGLAILTIRDRAVPLRAAGWIAAGFALTVLPLFGTDRWAVVEGTTEQSFLNSDVPLAELLGYNFVRSLFGFSFNPYGNHYTTGALMDGVSVTLAFAGLGLALAGLRRFGYRLLVIWFLVAIVVTGVLSQHKAVTVSRLHYALPPLAALAGLALDALVSAVSALYRRPRFASALTVLAIAALAPTVFILNGRQFFIYSAEHWPTTEITVLIRETMEPKCDDYPLRSIVYVGGPDAALDGTFRFFNREDQRPMQLAFEDLPWAYTGFGDSGGVGCLLVGDATSGAAAYAMGLLESGSGAPVHVVTDLTGQTKVGLVQPSDHLRHVDPSALAATWKTDFTKGAGLDLVVKAQEKRFLPSVDSAPAAISPDEFQLEPGEPVVVIRSHGHTRAYPVRFLMWHGVVNDVLGGVPIVVAYDPIAGAARAFERRVGERTFTFAVTGFMRNGNTLLYDAETETWWQQLSGQAVIGTLAGTQLRPVDFHLVSAAVYMWFASRSQANVDMMGPVLEGARYERNPYLHYDVPEGKPIFTLAAPDDRLRPLQRVAVIEAGGARVAVPYPEGTQQENFASTITVGGRPAALFFDSRTQSELDARRVFDSRAVGSFAAFETNPGTVWSADPNPELFADGSGATRDMLGEAVDGQGQGTPLTSVTHYTAFWFSVAGSFPGIEIQDLGAH